MSTESGEGHTIEQYRRTAIFVDKIFKGAKLGGLSVEQPTKFELLINGKTPKALGLTIPQSLLIGDRPMTASKNGE